MLCYEDGTPESVLGAVCSACFSSVVLPLPEPPGATRQMKAILGHAVGKDVVLFGTAWIPTDVLEINVVARSCTVVVVSHAECLRPHELRFAGMGKCHVVHAKDLQFLTPHLNAALGPWVRTAGATTEPAEEDTALVQALCRAASESGKSLATFVRTNPPPTLAHIVPTAKPNHTSASAGCSQFLKWPTLAVALVIGTIYVFCLKRL